MKRMRITLLISYAILLVFCTGCSGIAGFGRKVDADSHTVTVLAMDTVMELTICGDPAVLEEAKALITALEEKFSATIESSDISVLNREKECRVSDETYELIDIGKKLGNRTGGVLDITVYPIVRAWGFTTGEHRVPDKAEIEGLLRYVDYGNITLSGGNMVSVPQNTMVDLGSIAKGYTGDRILAFFREKGINNALINLGGNVQALGSKPDGSPWKVAVADPENSSEYAGYVEVIGKTVITSGAYERCFEYEGKTYHHIIDTSTGYPADNGFVSVSVIGESGVVCDALSTSLFAMGPQKAYEFWKSSDDFDAVFITSDGKVVITEGIRDAFVPLGRYRNTKPEVLLHDQK